MLRILATTELSWTPTIHFKMLSDSSFQQHPIPALLLYQQLNHGCATDMALNIWTMAENARQLKCGSTLSWECSLNGKPDLLLHVSNIARLLGGDYLQVFRMASVNSIVLVLILSFNQRHFCLCLKPPWPPPVRQSNNWKLTELAMQVEFWLLSGQLCISQPVRLAGG
jgi:hypothetical protein